MIIVALKSKSNFESKLKSILDTAKLRKATGIVILTDRAWHMEIFDYMLKHKGIGRIKMAGETYFTVKSMRIEVKPVDFYI